TENHSGSLVLRISGRAFSALMKLSSNATFFQYVERKFRQYPQNSITQFTIFVVRVLSLAHDILDRGPERLRDYASVHQPIFSLVSILPSPLDRACRNLSASRSL